MSDSNQTLRLRPIENILSDAASEGAEDGQNAAYSAEGENSEQMELMLGDIIRIYSPTNDLLHERIFSIQYIDKTKINLIAEADMSKTTLNIDENGNLANEFITKIDLLYRSDEVGYARQHGLNVGVWINVYFETDIPTILTGKITNLEEDMIEIATFPDNEIIYLNFEYKGIPETIPIQFIEIREMPASAAIAEANSSKEIEDYDDINNDNDNDDSSNIDEDSQELGAPIPILRPPTNPSDDILNDLLLDADKMVFGESITITEFVGFNRDKIQYDIDTQTNDLLEDFLSNIPETKRTPKVLNRIHKMITRFTQLRTSLSIFDENNIIVGTNAASEKSKPLLEAILNIKTKLYWVLHVVKHIKKIHSMTDDAFAEDDDTDLMGVKILDNYTSISDISTALETRRSSNQSRNLNYNDLIVRGASDLKPFIDPPSGNDNDIIYETKVGEDIDTIVDNLGDLKSTVFGNKELTITQFLIQRYNLGVNDITSPESISRSVKVKLVPDDNIAIKGLITLPESATRFSRINLPGTNIMDRANLNQTFINYWQILKNASSAKRISIDNFGEPDEEMITGLLTRLQHYTLDLPEDNIRDSNEINYREFISSIVPKTKTLFKSIKKYISSESMSLMSVISHMEPFMIYSDNITYLQYSEISAFIRERIRIYKEKYLENSENFQKLTKPISAVNVHAKKELHFLRIFKSQELNDRIFGVYGQGRFNTKKTTTSEVLRKIINDDSGDFFNISLASQNIELMFPKELTPLFEKSSDTLKEQLRTNITTNADKCDTYIIAKTYSSMQEANEDNNREIYFDTKYDNTVYSIIENYTKEQGVLNMSDFKLFLANELQKIYKHPKADATYMAESIIDGKKAVRDGQYAILKIKNLTDSDMVDTEHYLKRTNNIWTVTGEEVRGSSDSESICLLQKGCLFNSENQESEKCEDITISRDIMNNKIVKDILSQFDQNYDISKKRIAEKIRIDIIKSSKNVALKRELKNFERNKYDSQQRKIGKTLTKYGENLDAVKESNKVSPYAKLCSLILGQSNFVHKQSNITLFAGKYTRPAQETESDHWLYCMKTSAKLIPTFLYTLADVFIHSPDQYIATMNRIIKNIGVLSDDGDNWVDRHSGYTITSIEFSMEDGYKDGYKVISNDTLGDGATTITGTSSDTEPMKILSSKTKRIRNIITTLSKYMNVRLDNQYEFIYIIVESMLNDAIISEKDYNDSLAAVAAKAKTSGKSVPKQTYVQFYNSALLMSTLSAFFIAIQTAIPSIQTRKSVPKCTMSFDGYPMDGPEDLAGITYLACVVKSLKTNDQPWNLLNTIKIQRLIEIIKGNISSYYISNADVTRKLNEKREYLRHNNYTIRGNNNTGEHELKRWVTFLPPLRKFAITHIDNVDDMLGRTLVDYLTHSNVGQHGIIDSIKGLIIKHSLIIQQFIQKIISKKTLLLKNSYVPYMDNACCDDIEDGKLTPLSYFVKDNAGISLHNNIVSQLAHILRDVVTITNAPILINKHSVKVVFPKRISRFSDETVYRAFVHFCKFGTLQATPKQLVGFCGQKPLTIHQGDSIQEMVQMLKQEGRNYTPELLINMLQTIGTMNMHKGMIRLPVQHKLHDLKDALLNAMNNEFVNSGSDSFSEVMRIINVNIDGEKSIRMGETDKSIITKNILDFQDLLKTINQGIISKLQTYLQSHGNVGRGRTSISIKKTNVIIKFLQDLDTHSHNADDQQDRQIIYLKLNYIKTLITFMGIVFPEMLVTNNKVNMSIRPYWKLSPIHALSLQEMIKKYYGPISAMYDDADIVPLLKRISGGGTTMLSLAQNTPMIISETKYSLSDDYNTPDNSNSVNTHFGPTTCLLLYKNYILKMFALYMDASEDKSMIVPTDPEEEKSENVQKTVEFEDEYLTPEFAVDNTYNDFETLKHKTAMLLIGYIKIFMDSNSVIDINEKYIEDTVFTEKEYEKTTFTDRLKNMSVDERKVDNELKANKLGVWNRGLQRSLVDYDGDEYERGRKEAELRDEFVKNLQCQGEDIEDDEIDEAMSEQARGEYLDELELAPQRRDDDDGDSDRDCDDNDGDGNGGNDDY